MGPSPEWLQRRLRAIGQIPRNNLVDCTNFVLFELGHPTHVFDLGTLRGICPIARSRRWSHSGLGLTLTPVMTRAT
ncbi:MAG: phenylalanine--tRNA ligase beta subunit-related protein [Phycisphaerales bacterium]